MLEQGRLPMTENEQAGLDRLLARNGGTLISLTRRDPGESGPLLAHVDDDTYEIDAEGHYQKQKA